MEKETEINFNKFHNLIEEYETLIKNLTGEVDFHKTECGSHKAKITLLVKENSELSRRLKDSLKLSESEEIYHTYSENDLVENLKNQLNILTKEKESVSQLWQSSLQTVDYLEEELKLFQGRTHGYLSRNDVKKIQDRYELQIKELETKVSDLQTELNQIVKISGEKLDEKQVEFEKALQSQNELLELVKELQTELTSLQESQKTCEGKKKDLQGILDVKNREIQFLKYNVDQSRLKVEEAIQIVECALLERDAALLKETQAKEEVTKVIEVTSKMKAEFEETLSRKVNSVANEYEEKLKKFNSLHRKAVEDFKNSTFELEKRNLKCESLEREISILQKGDSQTAESSMSKLLILEKNLESTFQKLLLSEKKCLQLTSERDNIKSDLEQMGSYFERDIKAREVEKKSLEHQIKLLQNELDISNSNLLEVTSKMQQLHSTIKLTASEVKKQYSIKQILFKKALEEKVKNAEAENFKIYSELRQHLKLQMSLNKKWKAEAKSIHEKLSRRIQEIKAELVSSQNVNTDLGNRLKEAENKIEKYRQSLQTICKDVNSICK